MGGMRVVFEAQHDSESPARAGTSAGAKLHLSLCRELLPAQPRLGASRRARAVLDGAAERARTAREFELTSEMPMLQQTFGALSADTIAHSVRRHGSVDAALGHLVALSSPTRRQLQQQSAREKRHQQQGDACGQHGARKRDHAALQLRERPASVCGQPGPACATPATTDAPSAARRQPQAVHAAERTPAKPAPSRISHRRHGQSVAAALCDAPLGAGATAAMPSAAYRRRARQAARPMAVLGKLFMKRAGYLEDAFSVRVRLALLSPAPVAFSQQYAAGVKYDDGLRCLRRRWTQTAMACWTKQSCAPAFRLPACRSPTKSWTPCLKLSMTTRVGRLILVRAATALPPVHDIP